MVSLNIKPVIIEIAKLQMQPGDRLLLKFPPHVGPEALREIATGIQLAMPDLPVLVIPADIEASVLSAPLPAPAQPPQVKSEQG